MHIENEKKSFLCIVTRKKKIILLCFSHITSSHCVAFLFLKKICEASLHRNSFFCATRKKKSLSVVTSACSKKTHVARRKKRAYIVVFFSMQQACVENNVIGWIASYVAVTTFSRVSKSWLEPRHIGESLWWTNQ